MKVNYSFAVDPNLLIISDGDDDFAPLVNCRLSNEIAEFSVESKVVLLQELAKLVNGLLIKEGYVQKS